jgi:hypothetical protein
VTDAVGGDFYKSGPWMMKDVSDARSVATIDALIAAGARFEAPPAPKKKVASSSQSAIREAPAGWDVAEPGPAPERGPEIVAAIREIVDRAHPALVARRDDQSAPAEPEVEHRLQPAIRLLHQIPSGDPGVG